MLLSALVILFQLDETLRCESTLACIFGYRSSPKLQSTFPSSPFHPVRNKRRLSVETHQIGCLNLPELERSSGRNFPAVHPNHVWTRKHRLESPMHQRSRGLSPKQSLR